MAPLCLSISVSPSVAFWESKNLAYVTPPEPPIQFNISEPTLKEVKEMVSAGISNSIPGSSRVPYKVYKHCPMLLVRLGKILKAVWRRGKVATQWRQAEGVWIPKEEDSRNIKHFRINSLRSVDYFFKIMAQQLTEFLMKNAYTDTSVQKGGIPGVAGWLEHTRVVNQLIQEARESKGDLAALWLEQMNAYGSITQACQNSTNKVSCSREDQKYHSGLL